MGTGSRGRVVQSVSLLLSRSCQPIVLAHFVADFAPCKPKTLCCVFLELLGPSCEKFVERGVRLIQGDHIKAQDLAMNTYNFSWQQIKGAMSLEPVLVS